MERLSGAEGTDTKAGLVTPQEGKQELSAVLPRRKALRQRVASDLEGVQTKGSNKVFLMVGLNSEREPCGPMPQLLPHTRSRFQSPEYPR